MVMIVEQLTTDDGVLAANTYLWTGPVEYPEADI